MSLELPEIYLLSKQMNKELVGKEVVTSALKNSIKFQKLGFINKQASDFDNLFKAKVDSVISRGNVIRVKFDNGMNLILAPEYGGKILFHTKESQTPKFHLKLSFKDNTAMTVTLTGMGVIQALKDNELQNSYVFRRDFSQTTYPMDENFSFEQFSRQLADKKINIKSLLVGKDAIVVGLGNSIFQDIICRAGIHPKRKASELNEKERYALYMAIKLVLQERIRLGGKKQFIDFFGKQGAFEPAMGSNMKDKKCPVCSSKIEKLSLGGGQMYFCPKCQR